MFTSTSKASSISRGSLFDEECSSNQTLVTSISIPNSQRTLPLKIESDSQAKLKPSKFQDLIIPPVRKREDLIQKSNQVQALYHAFDNPKRPAHKGNLFYVLTGPSGSGKKILAQTICSSCVVKTDADFRNHLRADYYEDMQKSITVNHEIAEASQSEEATRFEKRDRNCRYSNSMEVVRQILQEAKIPCPYAK
jgi:DNA replication protein DnaC